MTIDEKIKDKIKYIRTVDELEIIRQKLDEIEDNCNYDKRLKKEIQRIRQEMVNLINRVDEMVFFGKNKI